MHRFTMFLASFMALFMILWLLHGALDNKTSIHALGMAQQVSCSAANIISMKKLCEYWTVFFSCDSYLLGLAGCCFAVVGQLRELTASDQSVFIDLTNAIREFQYLYYFSGVITAVMLTILDLVVQTTIYQWKYITLNSLFVLYY